MCTGTLVQVPPTGIIVLLIIIYNIIYFVIIYCAKQKRKKNTRCGAGGGIEENAFTYPFAYSNCFFLLFHFQRLFLYKYMDQRPFLQTIDFQGR